MARLPSPLMPAGASAVVPEVWSRESGSYHSVGLLLQEETGVLLHFFRHDGQLSGLVVPQFENLLVASPRLEDILGIFEIAGASANRIVHFPSDRQPVLRGLGESPLGERVLEARSVVPIQVFKGVEEEQSLHGRLGVRVGLALSERWGTSESDSKGYQWDQ